MKYIISLSIMIIFCSVSAFAQSHVISGKVIDVNNSPIPFASVKIKGSSFGVSADQDGAFTIKVKDGDVLEISRISFETKQVTVGSTATMTVQLKRAEEIREVVVTGASPSSAPAESKPKKSKRKNKN